MRYCPFVAAAAGNNARDRFVTLRWDFVEPMLDKIIAVGRDRDLYRQTVRQSEKVTETMAGCVWTVREVAAGNTGNGTAGNGGNAPAAAAGGEIYWTQDPPIFCSEDCGDVKTPTCRPCK